jgi:acetylornithine deacetylase
VSYGTDAGFFSNIGWPTIVCGPGNISQAHKADEFIEIEDIRNGILFFMDLIRGTSD